MSAPSRAKAIADPAVAAGDQGAFADKPIGTSIAPLTVIGAGIHSCGLIAVVSEREASDIRSSRDLRFEVCRRRNAGSFGFDPCEIAAIRQRDELNGSP
jgi:hypothetical protein